MDHPWTLSTSAVVRSLGGNLEGGLSDEEARERQARFGPNALKEEAGTSRIAVLVEQFKSPVVLTLIGASALSALLGDVVDTVAIGAILVLNAIIGYFQQMRAEEAVAALKKLAVPRTRVLRDGAVESLPAGEVTHGDVLVLEAGDYVPADARMVVASNLACDESPLTGESLPVEKTTSPLPAASVLAERANMIFAGTSIVTGSGRAIVTEVGMGTEIGRIARLLETSRPGPTPLQLRLGHVGNVLLIFSGVVVLLVAALGLWHGQPWLEVAMVAVSLAVAAIPEGLPTIVTIALALAVHRMTRRRAIVRYLPAVETLGSTDVICTDKTGTLTTGRMAVRDVVTMEGIRAHDDAALQGSPSFGDFIKAAVLCNNADLNDGGGTGDPTEVALLLLAKAHGVSPQERRRESPRLVEWPFDSRRKRMSVAIRDGKGAVLFLKGAPESILPLCRLPADERRRMEDTVQSLSRQGRRLLALAKREMGPRENISRAPEAEVEKDLFLLGLVAMADPPRPEAVRAVAQCRKAGIRVVMITGDHPATAEAIAAEMGIIQPDENRRTVAGAELDGMSPELLEAEVEDIAVYARVSPEQKLNIVRAWKSRGKIVAMTGDGVNDGPALKEASIGIAMGKGGTEVARQASAMVLADDNFATIVSAVEEGRAVHGNIERTIHYLLSGNTAEILIMLGASLAGFPVPFLPLHLLWINLVTDGFPVLALAAEPVPSHVLESTRKPSSSTFRDKAFYKEILFTGTVIAALTLGVYVWVLTRYETEARTWAFTFLVFEEIFRSFSSRSRRKVFFRLPFNPYHLVAASVPLICQIAILRVPFLREVFRMGALSWSEVAVIAAMAIVPVSILELRKLVRSPRHRR